MDGVAGDDRAPAGEGARTPVERIGVAGDNLDIGQFDPQLFGGDLGEAGEVTLPLSPDAGRDADFAGGLDLDAGALIGSDAGPFDIGHDADAGMASLLAQPWLLFLDEIVIPDQPKGVLQQGGIVAAVINERREILIDDVVVMREGVGGQEIAAADLTDVELQFAGRQIQQALDDEDAVLASGAAVGGDDGLVGEDDGELTGVIGNL